MGKGVELEGLIRLDGRDAARAAELLAEAFEDDPVFTWLMPEPASRRAAVAGIMRSVAANLMASGEAFAPGKAMEGVLFASFPGARRFRLAVIPAMAGSLLLPFRLARHISVTDLIRRVRSISAATAKLRRGVKKLGKAVHVDMIAVGREFRGQKFMSRMMRAVLDESDRRGLRCVLETETETNVRIYRHFGFAEERAIEAVPGGLTYHIMVHEPQHDGKMGLT
jgi:ribosomal protein S18 acetylase RimI-like enzyme